MTQFTRVSNVWLSSQNGSSSTPEEAMFNKLKADLVFIIHKLIVHNGCNQSEAAKQLSITQLRVSNVVHGQISKFSFDNLYKMLALRGYQVKMTMKGEKPSAKVAPVVGAA
ncbi:MAG: XRE family transcriptional regulator [Oleibacter sp.]|nr:XRE family transcriptional regulator [Thalassolituus sp.]